MRFKKDLSEGYGGCQGGVGAGRQKESMGMGPGLSQSDLYILADPSHFCKDKPKEYGMPF
jgi:hypothetical protein